MALPGSPVLISRTDVDNADRRFQWIKDTDRPDYGTFTIGRVLYAGDFGNYTVILPNGTRLGCNAVKDLYEGAMELLQIWEDWELENNGIAYDGVFVPTGMYFRERTERELLELAKENSEGKKLRSELIAVVRWGKPSEPVTSPERKKKFNLPSEEDLK